MKPKFRAHRGGNTQIGFIPLVYNFLDMTSEDYDIGNKYTNSLWTPISYNEESALVIFNGQIWSPFDGNSGLAFNGSENLVARIVKNGNITTGTTIGTAIGSKGPFSDDYVLTISMQDIAEPEDSYGIYLYTYNKDAWVDGNPLHTFWCGSVI